MNRESFSLVPDGSHIPIHESKRVSTDVLCTIVGAVIALTLFILACIFYSGCNPSSTQKPSTTITSPSPTDPPNSTTTTALELPSGPP